MKRKEAETARLAARNTVANQASNAREVRSPGLQGLLDIVPATPLKKAPPAGLDALYYPSNSFPPQLDSPAAEKSEAPRGSQPTTGQTTSTVEQKFEAAKTRKEMPGRVGFGTLGQRVAARAYRCYVGEDSVSWVLLCGALIRPGYYDATNDSRAQRSEQDGRKDYWQTLFAKYPKKKSQRGSSSSPVLLSKTDPGWAQLRFPMAQLTNTELRYESVNQLSSAAEDDAGAARGPVARSPSIAEPGDTKGPKRLLPFCFAPNSSVSGLDGSQADSGVCSGCRKSLKPADGQVSSQVHVCPYTGKRYCVACSSRFESFTLPSAVLRNFDFAEKKMSPEAAQTVRHYYTKPMIPMAELENGLLTSGNLTSKEESSLRAYVDLRRRLKYFYDHCVAQGGDSRIPKADDAEAEIGLLLKGAPYSPVNEENCSLDDLRRIQDTTSGPSYAEQVSSRLEALLGPTVSVETGEKEKLHLKERCALCQKKIRLKSYASVLVGPDGKPVHSKCLQAQKAGEGDAGRAGESEEDGDWLVG